MVAVAMTLPSSLAKEVCESASKEFKCKAAPLLRRALADSFLECGHYELPPASAAGRLMFIPFFALQTLLFLRQSASEDCQIPDGNCERRLRSAQCGRHKYGEGERGEGPSSLSLPLPPWGTVN